MPLEARLLTPADEGRYAELIARAPQALIYATLAYRDFLRDVLAPAEPCCLVVEADGRLWGALPAFSLAGEHGTVVNALPYYGSHGDVVIAPDADRETVEAVLLDGLAELARARQAVAVTLIAHPLRASEHGLVRSGFLHRIDDRIGQISHLPRARTREEAIEAILRLCRQKTRNLVRKGLGGGFSVGVSDELADWRNLHEHHVLGMARIGGRPKSWEAFSALRRHLGAAGLCRCYVARRDGAFAGGLVLLRHRDWVEYFTPVAVEAQRPEQVLSALIAEAMADSVTSGAHFWNWGGTWRSQVGVHHFKSGWGAEDHVYGYFGAALAPTMAELTPEEILTAYPGFYVRPFATAASRSVA